MKIIMLSEKNQLPKFWRQVTPEEFARVFFIYIFKKPEHRQIFEDADGNKLNKNSLLFVKVFECGYSTWTGLGVAMVWYGDNDIRYYKYGDPQRWKDEEHLFVCQFLGDNS
jgi:hypothetical protein